MTLNKIYHIACTECGTPTSYSWKPQTQPDHSLCYLCMHSVCDISGAFGINDGLTTQDLYRVDNENGIGNSKLQSWRMNVIHFKSRVIKSINKRKIAVMQAEKKLDKSV